MIDESEKTTVFSYHSSTPPTIKDWFLFFSAFIFISLYFYISVRKINYFKSTLTVCLGKVNVIRVIIRDPWTGTGTDNEPVSLTLKKLLLVP